MATNTVNFFQPGTEQAIDMRQVQRQRELADLLRQQGQTSPQGQMVSGHFVAPGKGAYVAQLANALFGNLASRRADEQEREMGQRIKTAREKESNDFLAALSGTPGQPARDIQPLTPNDDEGNPMPVARADAIPGMPADQNKALGIGMRSDNPTLQALAAKLMEQKMQDAAFESAFGAGAGGGAPGSAPAAGGAPAGPGGMLGAPDGGMIPQGGAMPAAGNAQFLGNNPGQVPAGLARLAFRKDPAEVAKMVMEARKPSNITEGGTLFNPATGQPIFTAPKTEAGISITGGQAAPVPGFQEAQARREALVAQARQGAESQNTMVTVKAADGREYQMTRQQALQLAGGGAPPQAPARSPVGPGYAGGSAAAAAGGQADILNSELGKAQQEFAAAQQRGDAAAATRAQADIAGIQRELGRLPGAGARAAAPAAPVLPGIPSQSPAEAAASEANRRFQTGVAEGAAGAVGDSRASAQSAAQTLANVAQIRSGIDKAILGPGANVRVTVGQIGQALGVTGKDNAEQLSNTRNVIQGLARQELAAAGQMKGQGQITENERAILRRAEAGDIGNFTKPELVTLLGSLEKTATYRLQAHNDLLKRAQAGETPMELMSVRPPADAPPAPAPAPAADGLPPGWTVKVR